ncbi:MAG TPA: YHS domain-containing (seleno)protein [Hyphomicrobiales bacterium]|nr:YHS domain-containing (seleno)protein [Kaistiaceae bacterium]HQF30477.1 YHS domain-containing (seleno)protein [Hyphomicrobiales bacterium]
MSRPRQQVGIRAALATAAVLAFTLLATAAAATERVVVDPLTGIAIGGYDPVSYFTGDEPRPGKTEYELSWNGAVWHFANEGNLAAFREAPEVYAPMYGGHCAMAAARNAIADGKPHLWRLYRERLYLFFSVANRASFDTDPARWMERADANWPELERALSR